MTDAEQVKDEVKAKCHFCGKRGGRVRIDPYREDVDNERVKVRLHDKCYGDLCDEI